MGASDGQVVHAVQALAFFPALNVPFAHGVHAPAPDTNVPASQLAVVVPFDPLLLPLPSDDEHATAPPTSASQISD
jgi:hypothetical protein